MEGPRPAQGERRGTHATALPEDSVDYNVLYLPRSSGGAQPCNFRAKTAGVEQSRLRRAVFGGSRLVGSNALTGSKLGMAALERRASVYPGCDVSERGQESANGAWALTVLPELFDEVRGQRRDPKDLLGRS